MSSQEQNFVISMYKHLKFGPLNEQQAAKLVLRHVPHTIRHKKSQDATLRRAGQGKNDEEL